MQEILEILQDALIDTVKLLPFLFLTYLIMEYIEHKTSKKARETIKKSGKFGPLIGALVGIVPQCGFSVSATSDEMLPILITEKVPIETILTILAIKLVIGIIAGFAIDFVIRKLKKEEQEEKIEELCEHDHCHCENGIIVSAIKHTLNIAIYILIITMVINWVISLIGEENIANFVSQNVVFGPVLAGIVGLVPNCASSVILTQLFVENVISMAVLIAGLLVNAGVGLLVLFRTNKNIRENFKIVFILYFIGVASGIILELFL